MATFERVDLDGDLNSGKSVFSITDSVGNQVQLSHLEAEQLMSWLQSFLKAPEIKDENVAEIWRFQLDDEIEHTLHGLRQVEHTLYEQHQHARFLREETVDGRRWIHVQSLTDSSVLYRIPFEEVRAVTRAIPGGGTVTHHFDKEEE
jgi:hypothetical protein